MKTKTKITAFVCMAELILLFLMADVTNARSIYGSPSSIREKRQSRSCRGSLSSDSVSFDVTCRTFFQAYTVSCTLDGEPFQCNGLQFSVPVNDVAWHTLEIVVEGTFYSYTGRVRSTLQFKRSVVQALPLHVSCSAVYEASDVVVSCLRVGENSQQIRSLQYSMNGGAMTSADSVSEFRVHAGEMEEGAKKNTISVVIIGESGTSQSLELEPVTPLSLRCSSRTSRTGVSIDCETNRELSSLSLKCYLEDELQSTCSLSTLLNYSELSQGRHTYTIVVTDDCGLTAKNQLSFESTVSTACRGSLNLGASVFSVSCDSSRDLDFTDCQLDGNRITCPASLQLDTSSLPPGPHTLQITGSDEFGNTATATSTFRLPESIGTCTVDRDEYDGVVDWSCTASQEGVSILCLVDGVPLDSCICDFNSQFFTNRFSEGDHKLELILSRNGFSEKFSHNFVVETLRTSASYAVEPLEFECSSQLNDASVVISCTANKECDLDCYLDESPHLPCGFSNVIYFKNISQGLHTFTVVARDKDGLVDRSEVHFEEDLDISCRGSYNPTRDIVHLACDSTHNLNTTATQCQLNNGDKIPCPLPYDLPVQEFVEGLSLKVEAQDEFGNSDTDQLTFLTSSCEGC